MKRFVILLTLIATTAVAAPADGEVPGPEDEQRQQHETGQELRQVHGQQQGQVQAQGEEQGQVLEQEQQQQEEQELELPGVLESIKVTAQIREEDLQDVPISVFVAPGAKLEGYIIPDLFGLAQYVPNLTIQEGSEGAAVVMRGIGNNGGTNFGFDSPVGTFIDGIYYGRANHARLPYFDVERVEVLRGPQSTLFGMNTVAGAISVVSRQPTDFFESTILADFDPRYTNARINGVVSGPLTDTLSARLAVMKTNHDGYVYNTFLDHHVNGYDDGGIRLSLRWKPAERWTLTSKLEHISRFQSGISRQVLSPPSDAGVIARQRALDPDVSFVADLDTSQNPESRDIGASAAIFTIDYAFDRFNLTSTSSYTAFNGKSRIDVDSSAIDVSMMRSEEDFAQFSQEFRITSATGGTFEYIAGVFYQDSNLTNDRLLDFALGKFLPAFAGTPVGLSQTYAGNFAQDFETLAAFGQVTWNIGDDWRLIGGGRLSSEEKRASSFFDWLVPGTTDPTNALEPGTPEFAIANFVFHDVFRIERHTDSGTYNENTLLPELKVQWYGLDDAMLYASFTKGQKSGGFNDRDNRATNFTFNPESSTNYEVGSKMMLLGGKAQLNLAFFRMEFKDMQVSVFDLEHLIFIVDNAAKAVSQGIEMDGMWRVTEDVTLNGALGWLETAKFVEFLVPCVPDPSDPDCISTPGGYVRDEGGENLNTPPFTASVGLAYSGYLTPSFGLNARVDFNYRSESLDAVNRVGVIEAASMLNARIELLGAQGWSFALVGNNLTDERFVESRIQALFAGSQQGSVRPPRTIAVQAGYSF